ncbi:MAG: Hsp20/alpha crystallin family protein [Melioribacteraceae bacterium]|nr:Hsp20/alpha crystallin family protein [Melioribacteraceae bacterium]
MTEVKNNSSVDKKSLIDEIINQPYRIPVVNIAEDENSFFIVADMPGVSKDNIELKLENSELTIIGKVDSDRNNSHKLILKEKRNGNYIRKFRLSDLINQSQIEAKLENGQLTIILPKKESIKPRSIEIA